jgi:hypothetical protein
LEFTLYRVCRPRKLKLEFQPEYAAPDGAWKFLPDDFLQICRTYGAKKLDSFQSKINLTA